jgi:class 3 adenylate cyclase
METAEPISFPKAYLNAKFFFFGINSGDCIAGITGKKKPAYDCWSDTVNIASRMCSTAVPGVIQITEQTYNLLPDSLRNQFLIRRLVHVKGIGMVDTYIHMS